MRESPKLKFKPEQPSDKVGIFKEGDKYYASLDGTHAVEVPEHIAENISIALRFQEKVDEAVDLNIRKGLLDMIAMMNCRKSIFAVTGSHSLRDLARQTKLGDKGKGSLSEFELSGIPQLLDDVERISKTGNLPILGSGENLEIEEYLSSEETDFPVIVHVFDVSPQQYSKVIATMFKDPESLAQYDSLKSMRFNHTFLVLGRDEQGKYACFHKQGPEIYQRFEITDLDFLKHVSVGNDPQQIHLTFIGPAPGQATLENQQKKAA